MFIVLLLIITVSCEDANQPFVEEPTTLELGNYEGTYTFIWNLGLENQESETCNTELSFFEGGYGIKEVQHICPPSSAGSCEITLTTITFQDTIFHTADFDHTLIIHGTYDYTFDNYTLEMSQINSEQGRKYIYKLTKTD
jgi:hypothetical protein